MTDIDPLITAHADAARRHRQRAHEYVRDAAAAVARADGCPTLHGAVDATCATHAWLRRAAKRADAAAKSASDLAMLTDERSTTGASDAASALARALANEAADVGRAVDEAELVFSSLHLYAGSGAAGADDSAHQADEAARLIHNLAATIAALPCTEAPLDPSSPTP